MPGLDVSLVTKTLQGGESRNGNGACLFERNVLRLCDQGSFENTDVLGDRSIRRAENVVAWFELGDVLSHGLNRPRAIDPEAGVLWLTHSGNGTH